MAVIPQRLAWKKYARCGFALGGLFLLGALCGCGGGDGGGDRDYISLGTAPVGGVFRPVGEAISSALNDNPGENRWRSQPKGTKGSQQNIRELDSGRIQLAMSNSAITYYAVRGQGVFEKPFPVRAIVTLAPNVGLFITPRIPASARWPTCEANGSSWDPVEPALSYSWGP